MSLAQVQGPAQSQRMGLLVTVCQGDTVDFFWAWPEGQLSASLDQVIAPLYERPEPWLEEARRVLIHREVDDRWRLEQRSELMLCSCNGLPLQAGENLYLQDGDSLDLGLCRVEVAMGPRASPQEGRPTLQADFDLTQLAHVAGRSGPPLNLAPGDVADLLHDGLGDALDESRSTAPSAEPIGRANPIAPAAPTTHDLAVGDAQATRTPHTALAAGVLVTDSPEASLEHLHQAYLRRLANPLSTSSSSWQSLSAERQQQSEDALQGLMDQAKGGQDLFELLGQSVHIQGVLAKLDSFGAQDILTPPGFENVMHLFAPVSDRPSAHPQPLPSLNRQEHHGMSLDSDMPPPTALTSASSQRKDLDHHD